MATVSLRHGWPLLVLFIDIVMIVGLVVGLVAAPGDYVTRLRVPDFVLPPLASSVLWLLLSLAFATAGWRMWMIDSGSTPMRLWLAIQILSWWWSPIFFLMHSPLAAFITMAIMCVLTLWFVVATWRLDRPSSLLFAPVLIYLGYVAAMNGAIVALN